MAWIEYPVVAAMLGGLIGAVITGAVSLFIWRKTHKIKRVDCAISDVSSLLSFSDTIRDELRVTYAGKQVDSVYLFNLDVFNTGTAAIRDQPVRVRLDGK